MALATAVPVAGAVSPDAGARSVPPPPGVTARFVTPFQKTGTVTYARHVLRERAGQAVARVWTIAEPDSCPAGPCPTVLLTRPRTGGVDVVALTLVAPGTWSGSGIFYVPERCGRRRFPLGGKVVFGVTIVATAAATAPDGTPVVTAVWGSYYNPVRYNLTPCPGGLGADAAVYTGTPIVPAPPAGPSPAS